MFGQKKNSAQICRVAYGKWGYEHDAGKSQLSVSAAYSSGSNAYSIDSTYKLDDDWSVYAAYDVNENSLNHVGAFGKIKLGDQNLKLDVAYNPGKDHLIAQASTKIEDVSLTAHVSLPKCKGSPLEAHSEMIEASVNVSTDDTVELAYDIQASKARVRYSRALDYKSTVRAEYELKEQKDHSVALRLTHKPDKDNTFTVDADLTGKSYALKWVSNADNGKWTVKTKVPFDKHPKDGTLSIKRRFDIDL